MNPSPRFLAAAIGLGLAATAIVGCGSDEAARRDDNRSARQRAWDDRHSQVHAASDQEGDASPEMAVAGDEGTLNAADVESAIARHRDELLDCYRLAGRASRRIGSRALLRFFVDAKGEVVDVAILESNIGHDRVERCLADIAVGVTLPPPSGRKPTTFDYPVEFRVAARPATVASRRRR